MSLNYITREELKSEIRLIHSDLRTIVCDFTIELKEIYGQIQYLTEEIEVMSSTIRDIKEYIKTKK